MVRRMTHAVEGDRFRTSIATDVSDRRRNARARCESTEKVSSQRRRDIRASRVWTFVEEDDLGYPGHRRRRTWANA